MNTEFRSGYVSIAGRPNVGKSTLLNGVLGEKIAIISRKPNTTRNRILGIKNLAHAQVVFLDTPGIHLARKHLNRHMVRQALSACGDADLVLLMIEATRAWQEDDLFTLKNISKLAVPCFLLINKIDKVEKPSLLPLIDESARLGKSELSSGFDEIFPISALTGDGVGEVVKKIVGYLPEGPAYFPEDMITDQAERFLAAEIIREKVFSMTQDEVPYSTAVTVENFKEDAGIIRIFAVIYVERDSQKGIIIGNKGAMLKKIGTEARKDLEEFLGQKVFLELFVRVEKDWTKRPRAMKKLGYSDR
jgi:GTP-binding protein Era